MRLYPPIFSVCRRIAGASSRADEAAAPPLARDAATLYAQFCANCHGANLQGNKAQSLLDADWQPGKTAADITRLIHEGVATSGMPAFGSTMTDAEIRALVVLIR